MGSTKNLFLEGQKIGPYTLVRELGNGSFGVVWLAEHKTEIVTSQVAIKLPLKSDIDINEFKKEAKVWVSAIGHPNILRFFTADIHEDYCFIASEFASGGALDDWLTKHGGKTESLESYKKIIEGIVRGLIHLHSKGIIHRDLKPKNVLLQDDEPLIADFGLARILRTPNLTKRIAGTPEYMSPEVFTSGDRCIEADLWAVGVIFYEMIKGVTPFRRRESILNDPLPELPKGVSDKVQLFIKKSLEKDKTKRFRSAEEMLNELLSSSRSTPVYRKVLRDLVVFKDVDEPWCPSLVVIPTGSFMMGAPPSDSQAYEDEKPQHEVSISNRFAIGQYLITISQYAEFCKSTGHLLPESGSSSSVDCPVINLCWIEAVTYLEWLSRVTGNQYRLPSEAEWEYCCRAGTSTSFSCGSEITTKHANLGQKSHQTTPVGNFPANPWNLYDMHGNVWEFVADVYRNRYDKAPTDGTYSIVGEDSNLRVVRGGSSSYSAKDNRSSVRCFHNGGTKDQMHGFRVARSL